MSATVRILFGTETGNAEDLARQLGKALQGAGYRQEVVDMDGYAPERLASERLVLVISSTFGNGDPPVNAEGLMRALKGERARLDGVPFAVCALGDTTYPRFAQCGRDFDTHLERQGGVRALPRVDCDVDYEAPFLGYRNAVLAWLGTHGAEFRSAEGGSAAKPTPEAKKSGLFSSLGSTVRSWFGSGEAPAPAPAPAPTPAPAPPPRPAFGRDRPFTARVLAWRRLNGPGSAKETVHYELDLSGSGFSFEPGDSFGVHPHNAPEEVEAILRALGLDGATTVEDHGQKRALREVLTTGRDLAHVTRPLVDRLTAVQGPAKDALVRGQEALKAWVADHSVAEALATAPARWSAQEVVDALRPLAPRLYSVANSRLVYPEQVHFTVETLRYQHQGRPRQGVASTWLADRLGASREVPLHLVPNERFRLPADGRAPLILIGPGTGVAPFRAFLQQRQAQGASGKAWLFFGHQHQATDFLYREDWEAFQAAGVLTQLSLAWSRDQAHKVYVQHRLLEQAAEVYRWIEEGAYLYVCGDKLHMAADVRAALVQVMAQQAGQTAEQAEARVQDLEASGRYRIDVY